MRLKCCNGFVLILGVLLLSLPLGAQSRSERVLGLHPGYLKIQDLPKNYSALVDTVEFEIKDAMDGAVVHSDADALVFEFANKLHIESRENTIRKRLLFSAGDTITVDKLIESERALRTEEFLADAATLVKPLQGGRAKIRVVTFDQWTTNLPIGVQLLGGQWIYWVGLTESNILGTGQKIGVFFSHDQFRNTEWVNYQNNSLFEEKLQLTMSAGKLSDGYNYSFYLQKPLRSRSDEYSYSFSSSGSKLSEHVYLDANSFDRLDELGLEEDSIDKNLLGVAREAVRLEGVNSHDVTITGLRSFGDKQKVNAGFAFSRLERYRTGTAFNLFENRVNNYASQTPSFDPTSVAYQKKARLLEIFNRLGWGNSALETDLREDLLIGLTLSLYRYEYKTVNNFRNLKWSEDLDVGWRMTNQFDYNVNQRNESSRNYRLKHTLILNEAWQSKYFVNSNATMQYYLGNNGDFEDGSLSGLATLQWKPLTWSSSYFSSQWNHLFAAERSQQLLLGEDLGLTGYPNQYYAGHARILLEAEQRFFPSLEFGTFVPAFAAFGNAGNTFQNWDDLDWNELHYSLGLGLRLGLSKSTQKVVNHINLTWPLDKDIRSGYWPVFSIRAKASL